ncbi:MAG: cation:proton antiporter, partial [Roseiarcus sp.]
MNAAIDLAVYKEALLFLVTAGIVAPLFFRLRVSPVLGFLLAGVALGPSSLGRLVARAPSFGVVFLLFMMGLELSFERLTRMRRLVFGLGAAQVALSSLSLGAIAFWLGQPPASAVVIGAALSLSSTAVIIPVLAERKRLNLAAGRVSFAVLLFQDLAVAPLLFMVTMLVGGRESVLGVGLALTLAPAALALTGLIVLGRLVLRPLFHSVAMTKSTEFFMAACLLVVLGTGLIAAISGLSMALGAFIAGLLLAETEYRREIE